MKNSKLVVAITALLCVASVSASLNLPRPSGADLSRRIRVDITVDDILKGALGNDIYGISYASKVNQMRYYDYSRKGFPNLWMRLMREVDAVNADLSLTEAAKVVKLKTTIEWLYTNLIKYKS